MLKSFIQLSNRKLPSSYLGQARFSTTPQGGQRNLSIMQPLHASINPTLTNDWVEKLGPHLAKGFCHIEGTNGNLIRVRKVTLKKDKKDAFLNRKFPTKSPVLMGTFGGIKIIEKEESDLVECYYAMEDSEDKLDRYIYELKMKSQYMTKEEYRNLMENTVFTLRALDAFTIGHSQLSMRNIIWKKGSWVLTDFALDPSLGIIDEAKIFQAPEKVLQKPNTCVRNMTNFASDLFSIGIILLAAGELWKEDDVRWLYSNGVLDKTKLKDALQNISTRYGQDLSNILKEFLSEDLDARVDAFDVLFVNTFAKQGTTEITQKTSKPPAIYQGSMLGVYPYGKGTLTQEGEVEVSDQFIMGLMHGNYFSSTKELDGTYDRRGRIKSSMMHGPFRLTSLRGDDLKLQMRFNQPMASVGARVMPEFTYVGQLLAAQKHGFGTLIFTDGTYIEGYFKNDLPFGKVKYRLRRQDLFYEYYGELDNYLPTGAGTIKNEVVTVEGNFDKGGLVGNAKLITFEGEYFGPLDTDFRPFGKGTFKHKNGMIFEGEFHRNLADLNGKFTIISGRSRYEGDLVHGLRHGYGKYTEKERMSYEGWFQNDIFHGEGVLEQYHPYLRVEGYFERGIPVGKVKLQHHQAYKYEGPIHDMRPHGEGVLIDNEGTKFIGTFKNGDLEGKGTRITKKGEKYEGDFKASLMDGHGEYHFADGTVYKGHWKGNVIEGRGEMFYKDGGVYKGMFKLGVPHGDGIYTAKDGTQKRGEWINGQLNEKSVWNLFK